MEHSDMSAIQTTCVTMIAHKLL